MLLFTIFRIFWLFSCFAKDSHVNWQSGSASRKMRFRKLSPYACSHNIISVIQGFSTGRKFASFGIFGWYSIGLICSCGYFIPIHFPPLGFLVLLVHLICTRGAPIWSPSLHIFAHQNKGGKQNKNKVDFLLRRINLVFAH